MATKEQMEKSLRLNKEFVENISAEDLDEIMKEFDEDKKPPKEELPSKATLILLGLLAYAVIIAGFVGVICGLNYILNR